MLGVRLLKRLLILEDGSTFLGEGFGSQINSTGEISDTRTTKSRNTLKRELSDKEKLERAEAKIKLLEAENELLKKTN